MRPSRSTVVAVAAGSLITLAAGGAAVLAGSGALAADSPSPSASAPPGSGSARVPGTPGDRFGHRPGTGGLGLRGLGGDVLHGEVVVKKADGSGTETLLVQHGTITAKGADSVTVKSSDGFTTTWKVTSTTIVPGPHPTSGNPGTPTTPPANGTLADLAVGTDVQAVGTRSGDGATARMIHGRPTLPAGAANGQVGPGSGRGHDGRGFGPGSPAPTPKAST